LDEAQRVCVFQDLLTIFFEAANIVGKYGDIDVALTIKQLVALADRE
jgi:hypothetical protein